MRLSLMTIGDAGVTFVSGQPLNVVNSRSSMMTSPVIDVTPAAATCRASESSAASGSPCTGALSRPLLAYVWSLTGESSKYAVPSGRSRRPMLMSPDATSTRSPETTPSSSGPVRNTGVRKRWSGPHASRSVATAKDFMIEPGTNSVCAPWSKRTSPLSASRTATPKWAWVRRSEIASIASCRSGGPGTSPGPPVLDDAVTTAVGVDVAVVSDPESEHAEAVRSSTASAPTLRRAGARPACSIPNRAPSNHAGIGVRMVVQSARSTMTRSERSARCASPRDALRTEHHVGGSAAMASLHSEVEGSRWLITADRPVVALGIGDGAAAPAVVLVDHFAHHGSASRDGPLEHAVGFIGDEVDG